jgi:hypothetical protein
VSFEARAKTFHEFSYEILMVVLRCCGEDDVIVIQTAGARIIPDWIGPICSAFYTD